MAKGWILISAYVGSFILSYHVNKCRPGLHYRRVASSHRLWLFDSNAPTGNMVWPSRACGNPLHVCVTSSLGVFLSISLVCLVFWGFLLALVAPCYVQLTTLLREGRDNVEMSMYKSGFLGGRPPGGLAPRNRCRQPVT